MNPLHWSAAPWVAVAAICALGALLAYKWTYTTTRWNATRRRNQQWLLIVALLAAVVLAACRAWVVS